MTNIRSIDSRVTPEGVRAQMARILASEAFAKSPRMRRFLEFIVEETLAGRCDQLGEYGIGVAVYDRGQDFEPALDPIVRNDARRLRFKLLEFYGQFASQLECQVVIDIPKGGYVPVFLPGTANRRPDPGGVISAAEPLRLAVLPFEVLSASAESAPYGRALCMSLTAHLTNLEGLEAVAHGFIQDLPLHEAAHQWRLSHAIHGSIVKASGCCRVTVNLIDASKGTQVWAREYDFASTESLTLQSEITRNVLSEVTVRLGLSRPKPKLIALAA